MATDRVADLLRQTAPRMYDANPEDADAMSVSEFVDMLRDLLP